MQNEIAKTEARELMPMTPVQGEGGEVLSSDVTIPKLLLMQAMSVAVDEGNAQKGDMVRTEPFEKLGDAETPLQFIPLSFKNYWVNYEIVKGKEVWKSKEIRNAKNEHEPWNYTLDGVECKRTKVLEVFALLPSDIAKEVSAMEAFKKSGALPDLNATLLPVVISFRSTSFKAGQAVVTHFVKAQTLSLQTGKHVHPYAYKLELSCVPQKNDQGSWFAFMVKSLGACNKDEVATAQKWYTTLSQSNNIRVDDSDELGKPQDVKEF
jgi:hypothetical protein